MAQLKNGQFRINGYTFGCGQPVDVTEFETGGWKWRVQDDANPTGDGILVGRDYADGMDAQFKIVVKGTTPAEALEANRAFQAAWEDQSRTTPGHIIALSYGIAGRVGRIYGRPREVSVSETTLFSQPRAKGEAVFQRTDPLYYSDVSQGVDLTLFPAEAGGLIFPTPFPWGSTPGGPRSGVIQVEGDRPTPIRAVIYGPVTSPKLTGPGWSITLSGLSLAWDQSVTIDSRNLTVLRNDGASMAQYLTRGSYLRDAAMRPGVREVTYQGTDNTGTSRATVDWYPAYKAL